MTSISPQTAREGGSREQKQQQHRREIETLERERDEDRADCSGSTV